MNEQIRDYTDEEVEAFLEEDKKAELAELPFWLDLDALIRYQRKINSLYPHRDKNYLIPEIKAKYA